MIAPPTPPHTHVHTGARTSATHHPPRHAPRHTVHTHTRCTHLELLVVPVVVVAEPAREGRRSGPPHQQLGGCDGIVQGATHHCRKPTHVRTRQGLSTPSQPKVQDFWNEDGEEVPARGRVPGPRRSVPVDASVAAPRDDEGSLPGLQQAQTVVRGVHEVQGVRVVHVGVGHVLPGAVALVPHQQVQGQRLPAHGVRHTGLGGGVRHVLPHHVQAGVQQGLVLLPPPGTISCSPEVRVVPPCSKCAVVGLEGVERLWLPITPNDDSIRAIRLVRHQQLL